MSYGGSSYGGSPYGGSEAPSVSASVVFVYGGSCGYGGGSYGGAAPSSAPPPAPPSARLSVSISLTASSSVPVEGAADLSVHVTLSASTTINGQADLSVTAAITATGVTIPSSYSPIGDTHLIRYFVTTLDTQPLSPGTPGIPVAELPFENVTFSPFVLNTPGPFSATLYIEDEQVLNTNWINGTNPGKTFFWVDIDGDLVYGGRILQRVYNETDQSVTLTGMDFNSYWQQRLQAGDYTTVIQEYTTASGTTYYYDWSASGIAGLLPATGVPAPMVPYKILTDAAAVTGSMPNLQVPIRGQGPGTKSDPDTWVDTYPSEDLITFSAPKSQYQTVDSLSSQITEMGYGIGVDIVTEVAWQGNKPTAFTYIAWPRFGKTFAEQGTDIQVLDLSSAIDIEWSEDASSQATSLVELFGNYGGTNKPATTYEPALETYNYPLLEQAVSHTDVNPLTNNSGFEDTLLAGDQDLYTYPQLAPVVTLPVFGWGTGFSLASLPLGDDVKVFNPYERQGLYGAISLPFPPKGLLELPGGDPFPMRIVRVDVTIADQGVSTMQLTLNPAPGTMNPPGYNTG